jgi:hypothetical protein
MAPRPWPSRLLAKSTPLVLPTPAATPLTLPALAKEVTHEETNERSTLERARPLAFGTRSRFLIENSVY